MTIYTGIVGKQNPVEQESDPNEDAKPTGGVSIHDGGADYDMPDATADLPEERNMEPVCTILVDQGTEI